MELQEYTDKAAEVSKEIHKTRPQWEMELTGSWLWIRGTSKTDKAGRELLKSLGCRWSPNKECWYLKGRPCASKSSMDMGYIRTKYGSQVLDDETN